MFIKFKKFNGSVDVRDVISIPGHGTHTVSRVSKDTKGKVLAVRFKELNGVWLLHHLLNTRIQRNSLYNQ